MQKNHYSVCPCAQTGANGTNEHDKSSNIVVEQNTVSVIPCLNHLHLYLGSGWTRESNWKEDIYQALIRVAKREPEWTNDDVFEEFDKAGTTVNPDRRSYGNVVQKALKEGIMEWTGSTIVSRRKNCHKMLIRVYKSNIYKYTPMSWFIVLWNHIKLWGV